MSKDLKEIEKEVQKWAEKSFGEYNNRRPLPSFVSALLGMNEEIGELNHHVLKQHQGIREGEDHLAGIKDAMADLLIYACDFVGSYNVYYGTDLSLIDLLNETWEENVSKRTPDGVYVPIQDHQDIDQD